MTQLNDAVRAYFKMGKEISDTPAKPDNDKVEL